MKTRAFLVKDIDPEILKRLLGNRSLATELSKEQLGEYYCMRVVCLFGYLAGCPLPPSKLPHHHEQHIFTRISRH